MSRAARGRPNAGLARMAGSRRWLLKAAVQATAVAATAPALGQWSYTTTTMAPGLVFPVVSTAATCASVTDATPATLLTADEVEAAYAKNPRHPQLAALYGAMVRGAVPGREGVSLWARDETSRPAYANFRAAVDDPLWASHPGGALERPHRQVSQAELDALVAGTPVTVFGREEGKWPETPYSEFREQARERRREALQTGEAVPVVEWEDVQIVGVV